MYLLKLVTFLVTDDVCISDCVRGIWLVKHNVSEVAIRGSGILALKVVGNWMFSHKQVGD